MPVTNIWTLTRMNGEQSHVVRLRKYRTRTVYDGDVANIISCEMTHEVAMFLEVLPRFMVENNIMSFADDEDMAFECNLYSRIKKDQIPS